MILKPCNCLLKLLSLTLSPSHNIIHISGDHPVQAAISWRASGDRQISLNASAERAFANFRDKKHRILQLQIFATKTFFYKFCNKKL